MRFKVGDTIEATFFNKTTTRGVVVSIEPRFAIYNKVRTKPLVTVREEDGNIRPFDSSYVTKVIEVSRATPTPYNSFANYKYQTEIDYLVTGKRNVLYGPLPQLAVHFLSQLPFEIHTQLNIYRLVELYKKNPVGLISCDQNVYYRVDSKRFKKWIRANYHRIVNTVKEQTNIETEIEEDYLQEYWEDVKAWEWEELHEKLC